MKLSTGIPGARDSGTRYARRALRSDPIGAWPRIESMASASRFIEALLRLDLFDAVETTARRRETEAAEVLELQVHHRTEQEALDRLFWEAQPLHRRGTPATIANGGTSFVTTEPAPMIAPSPMDTPPMMLTLWPATRHCDATVWNMSGVRARRVWRCTRRPNRMSSGGIGTRGMLSSRPC